MTRCEKWNQKSQKSVRFMNACVCLSIWQSKPGNKTPQSVYKRCQRTRGSPRTMRGRKLPIFMARKSSANAIVFQSRQSTFLKMNEAVCEEKIRDWSEHVLTLELILRALYSDKKKSHSTFKTFTLPKKKNGMGWRFRRFFNTLPSAKIKVVIDFD